MFSVLALLSASLVITIFSFVSWRYSYWQRKKIPYITPKFPFGTIENPFSRLKFNGNLMREYYNHFKSHGHKYGGMFTFLLPNFLVVDLEYIKYIMLKDFNHFTDRGSYLNKKGNPLSGNLLNLTGHEWKTIRVKLTPAFTSSKLKVMFPTILACGAQLQKTMKELVIKDEPIDIKHILDCYTIDVIGSCAFGIECNSFKRDSKFVEISEKLFNKSSKLTTFLQMFTRSNQRLSKFLGISLSNPEVTNFFINLVKDTTEFREKNNIERKDFMQILMEINKNDKNIINGERAQFTIEELTAHAFIFFVAGFETSASTMSFCLYELAQNQEWQQKVRKEVTEMFQACKNCMDLDYEVLNQAQYLNQAVDETLRMYPPGHTLGRLCVEDYKLPNTSHIIEKGTHVTIPIYSLHYDPEYFPDPNKFDPERFGDENKPNIRPFSYMPFGEGPRSCIGARLGKMQTKIGLAFLLKDFKFSINKRTDVPLKMNPLAVLLSPISGIWLDVLPIDNKN